jgi:membrane fusion protein (multidrug efflux system)
MSSRLDATPAQTSAQVDETSEEQHRSEERRRPGKRPLIILASVVLVLVVAGGWYWFSTRDQESTDDAFTDGNSVTIAPKVEGYVVELNINDNTRVTAGDLMVKIDQRDFIAARDQAAAALAIAKAQAENARINLQIVKVTAPARLAAAQARLDGALADQTLADTEAGRQTSAGPRATPQTAIDMALADARSTAATVAADRAQVQIDALVQQNIDLANAQLEQLEAQVRQAQAQLAQAELNLGYTELRAPQDGWVTRRNVDLGTYLQVGQEIFSLVTPEVWITPTSRRPSSDGCARGSRSRSASTAIRNWRCVAMSTASRWAAGRCSACSPPRTPPATSSTSSSACR